VAFQSSQSGKWWWSRVIVVPIQSCSSIAVMLPLFTSEPHTHMICHVAKPWSVKYVLSGTRIISRWLYAKLLYAK